MARELDRVPHAINQLWLYDTTKKPLVYNIVDKWLLSYNIMSILPQILSIIAVFLDNIIRQILLNDIVQKYTYY